MSKWTRIFAAKRRRRPSSPNRLRWVCAYLEIDDDGKSDGNGGEAVLSGGMQVGTVSSIAFGHGVGKLLAFAYVQAPLSAPGTALQVIVMGDARAARVLAVPAYDPDSVLPRTDATVEVPA